jgi:hypothetical protein
MLGLTVHGRIHRKSLKRGQAFDRPDHWDPRPSANSCASFSIAVRRSVPFAPRTTISPPSPLGLRDSANHSPSRSS